MVSVDEIAPDTYRLSTYIPQFELQFNQFLVVDDEPLLFHTGMRALFPAIKEAVSRVIDPAKLRWISFSHFEVDECGSLNDWLAIAPRAQAACSVIGARVNMSDFSSRPVRELNNGDEIVTGRHRFRFFATPHFPHGWDAGMLFDETTRTLFCSDFLHSFGNGKPLAGREIVESFAGTLLRMESGALPDYMPCHDRTETYIETLAGLKPETLAIMHGSSFKGDGAKALRDGYAILLKHQAVNSK